MVLACGIGGQHDVLEHRDAFQKIELLEHEAEGPAPDVV
jgi:hypothetical protein